MKMKIQTNKYIYLIILIILTIVIFTVSFFLIGKIWEKKSNTNNTSNSSSVSNTQEASNSTKSSSNTSTPLFSTEGIENDKYYGEVVKLGEEFKKLVLTGESDYINPNNKGLLYHDSEEHFFEDFVSLEKSRVEIITKTEISRFNIPTFCTDLMPTSDNFDNFETQFEIALKGYDVPLVKKVNIDGLYFYEIFDSRNDGKLVAASELILVKNGKAKFINMERWIYRDYNRFTGERKWKGLVLKCDID